MLAVAYSAVPPKDVYRADDEKDLVLAGFLTFSDPPLESAKLALHALRRDGVEVKILTGDNELVTQHICSQVGLDSGRIILGDELERMTDPALAHVVEQTSVFARVSPAQKNRIILALKHRSHVVGYLGDGINDAPSLHAADVGISVSTAVDVAKDAADFILLERSLSVLHEGIIEGRKSFGNVMKYLLMGTSSNFGNMFSMAVASLFLPFLPMLPTQILLNNFLYDLAQVTIPTDHVDRHIHSQATALEREDDPRLHDLHWANQFDLRLPDVLCVAQGLQRLGTTLPHRLVRRIAGDPDARHLYHSHRRQSFPQPSQSGVDGDNHRSGHGRHSDPVYFIGKDSGVHAFATCFLSLPWRSLRNLPAAGGTGEAKANAQTLGIRSSNRRRAGCRTSSEVHIRPGQFYALTVVPALPGLKKQPVDI